jgi:WhiB family transcriptional regulator, redox-sensing transcriptional regulator
VLEDARCRDEPAELFFGPSHTETRRERVRRERRAKALCDDCSVLDACRAHALEHPELHGVWGGLGELERRVHLVRAGRLAGGS